MQRVTVRVAAARVEEALDVLLALLPAGVHERATGRCSTELVALCTDDEAAQVPAVLGGLALGAVRIAAADDLASELDRLRPAIEVAGRLVIRPPAAPEPPPGVVDVVIAARAFGFGTGAHPTTRLCLELLLDLKPRGALADLGCGAGAVLVAAAKLGWSPVVGVDHSSLALGDARVNLERNSVDAQLLAADLAADPLPGVATAVANVSDLRVHARLAGEPLTTLVVSGLKRGGELETSLRRYADRGFALERRREDGDWAAVVLRRSGGRRPR